MRRPQSPPLFPYPPLSRSLHSRGVFQAPRAPGLASRVLSHAPATAGKPPLRSPYPALPAPGALEVAPRVLSRSEEHTSELQSRLHLVCRLLLEKKKNIEWL